MGRDGRRAARVLRAAGPRVAPGRRRVLRRPEQVRPTAECASEHSGAGKVSSGMVKLVLNCT